MSVSKAQKDLVEAAKHGLRYVQGEIMKIINNNGNASALAWERICAEPIWIELKAKEVRFEAAIKKASGK